jgi:hypothetical protein
MEDVQCRNMESRFSAAEARLLQPCRVCSDQRHHMSLASKVARTGNEKS